MDRGALSKSQWLLWESTRLIYTLLQRLVLYYVQLHVSGHLDIMHLPMQKSAWINKHTHTHTHTCCLHISRFSVVEWKRCTLLIHNAERIYGNCSFDSVCACACVHACDAVQQPRCCSCGTTSLIFSFVSCSRGMWHQYITQLLAKSVFFIHRFPGVFEKRPCSRTLSDVFLFSDVDVFGSAFIKCSLLPVFAEARETFQLVGMFVSVIHLEKCFVFALAADVVSGLKASSGLGSLAKCRVSPVVLTSAACLCKLALWRESRGESPYGSCETWPLTKP